MFRPESMETGSYVSSLNCYKYQIYPKIISIRKFFIYSKAYFINDSCQNCAKSGKVIFSQKTII